MEILLVSLVALFFLFMGLQAILLPESLGNIVGFSLDVDRGPNEMRAVYGGFGLAMAGMAWWAVFQTPVAEPYLIALAIALFGMAGGRIISLIIEREIPLFGVIAASGEAIMAVMLLTAVSL